MLQNLNTGGTNQDSRYHRLGSTPTAGTFELETLDVAATDGEVCNCSGDLYNCRDFSSHAEAQGCFEYCVAQGRGDIHLIDINNNGIACEALLP
jgi:hypothetical protein